jgi:hypothetical protein
MLKLFKRKKIQKKIQVNEQEGIFKVHNAERLLSFDIFQGKLQELKNLSKATEANYQEYYQKPLDRYAEYVQRLPAVQYAKYNCAGGLLEYTLDVIIASLKFREAYMMPPGGKKETSHHEQSGWTQAIFLSALLQNCWQVAGYFEVYLYCGDKQLRQWDSCVGESMPIDSALTYRFIVKKEEQEEAELRMFNSFIVRGILPHKSNTNLYQYHDAFKYWFSHISYMGDFDNPITNIIKAAETKLMIGKEDEAWLSKQKGAIEMPKLSEIEKQDKVGKLGKADKLSESKKQCLSEHLEDEEAKQEQKPKQEIQIAAMPSTYTEPTRATKTDRQQEENKKPQHKKKQQIKANKAAEDNLMDVEYAFVNLLREAVEQGKIDINARRSIIHRVEEGVFVPMPNALNWFIDRVPNARQFILKKDSKLQRGFIKHFKKSRIFEINSDKYGYLHKYYWGDWDDQNFVIGLLSKNLQAFFLKKEKHKINNNLHVNIKL